MTKAKHTPVPADEFTPFQASWAFNEIHESARLAKTLCIEAINTSGTENRDTKDDLIASARALIERIGWIAESHAFRAVDHVAASWMLPPAYHWEAEKPEAGVADGEH